MTAKALRGAVVAYALLLAGCGTLSGGTHVDYAPPSVLDEEALGACPRTPPPAPPEVVPYLARPGAWLRLTRVGAAEGSKPVPATYDVLGGDPSYIRRLPPHELVMPAPVARAAADALEAGGTVVAHTGDGGDPARVAYAFATAGEDEFAFLGECAFGLRQRLREEYDISARDYLDAITGQPGREVRRLLGLDRRELEWERTPWDQRALAPGLTPKAVLNGLAQGRVRFVLPESWQQRGSVGTRTPGVGSGEGIEVASPSVRWISVAYWLDPADPRLLVVYHPETPGSAPVVLATVDVGRLARAAGHAPPRPRHGPSLRVELPSSPSAAEVLADPARYGAVATVTIG